MQVISSWAAKCGASVSLLITRVFSHMPTHPGVSVRTDRESLRREMVELFISLAVMVTAGVGMWESCSTSDRWIGVRTG